MFFDPDDWSSMAGRIEWALNNLALLLEKQSTLYKRIAQRTWAEVVGDYIKILERIAAADSLMVKSD